MIHILFGIAVIIMAAVTMVDPARFIYFNYFLLTVSIVGGIASIYNGSKGAE